MLGEDVEQQPEEPIKADPTPAVSDAPAEDGSKNLAAAVEAATVAAAEEDDDFEKAKQEVPEGFLVGGGVGEYFHQSMPRRPFELSK